MNATEALKAAGFKPEKSTVGDKIILKGIYKATMFKVAEMEDKGYGPSIYAQFKIQEVLSGDTSYSQYPEFAGYFNTAPDKIGNKSNGLAKLINGLFSAGHEVNTDNVVDSLSALLGSEVYINGYRKEPMRKVEGTEEWEENPDGVAKQAFAFMTKDNAEKKAKKNAEAKPF